jgi:sec-independent protein translocase protein TatB
MRKVGQFMAKVRGMAAEFRASFDELARQSELDELRREVEALRTARPMDFAATHLGAGDVISEIRSDLADTHAELAAHAAPVEPPATTEPPAPPTTEAASDALAPTEGSAESASSPAREASGR